MDNLENEDKLKEKEFDIFKKYKAYTQDPAHKKTTASIDWNNN